MGEFHQWRGAADQHIPYNRFFKRGATYMQDHHQK